MFFENFMIVWFSIHELHIVHGLGKSWGKVKVKRSCECF